MVNTRDIFSFLYLIFHNLKGYDCHLIIKQIGKFDVKGSALPRGLEKYIAFTINK